ncbi:MAG: hypothetical protein ACK4VN_13485 [Bacteroidales bacterium]
MRLSSKIIIVTIVLSSIGLLHLRGLGIFVRLMDVITAGGIIFLFLIYTLYSSYKHNEKQHFTIPILFIIAGVLISVLPAKYIHGQPITISLYQQRHMYAFLFYFILFYLRPEKEWLFNLFLYMSLTIGLLYVIQYVLYPIMITDAKVFVQRGTIRMNLPGAYYMTLGFYLSVDRFFSRKNIVYGISAIFLFSIAILSGFRTTVASYILISSALLLFSKRIKNRLLLTLLFGLFFISGIFAFQNVVDEMISSAQSESVEGTENIRYRAAEFLLSLNNEDKSSYILGNGEPSQRSRYGMKLFVIAITRGYYLSDIGIFGFYFKFGIIPTASVIIIMLMFLTSKVNPDLVFIKLFFIHHTFIIANSLLPFDDLAGIIMLCMLFYLYDINKPQDQLNKTT